MFNDFLAIKYTEYKSFLKFDLYRPLLRYPGTKIPKLVMTTIMLTLIFTKSKEGAGDT